MIESELAPFISGGDPHAKLAGPQVTLQPDAVQPLAMAIHELATNAVKHGALSVAEGRVKITWDIAPHASEQILRFRWAELGGPPVGVRPERRGFGSLMLEGAIETQLRGRIARRWETEGLICEIEMPLGRVRLTVGAIDTVTAASAK